MNKTSIIEMTNEEAKRFFMRSNNYCNLDLPVYFNFQPILDGLSSELEKGWALNAKCSNISKGNISLLNHPEEHENVNYKLYSNKDGKYAWRPLQIINPFVYIVLVNLITDADNWKHICSRIHKIRKKKSVVCYSLPFDEKESEVDKKDIIINWWKEIEQQSIKMSIDYKYMLNTDITDCYGALYTHAISWALHGIPASKDKKNRGKLLGDKIDTILRWSTFNQTNGIPQGSVLMDFIAEIVLCYADDMLVDKIKEYNTTNKGSKSLQIGDYKILRYRDDYRIFTHTQEEAARIAKILSSVLADLNFKLNVQKTFITDKIITSAIKPDKIYWNKAKNSQSPLQKHLLLIHGLSEDYPNSGSIIRALSEFLERIYPLKVLKEYDTDVLIAILIDIAYRNPKTYPHVIAIIGKMLTIESDQTKRKEIINRILRKFDSVPNTEYLQIWIQRLTIVEDRKKVFNSKLCQALYDKDVSIWDNGWLHSDFKKIIESKGIVDESVLGKLPASPSVSEVNVFANKQY